MSGGLAVGSLILVEEDVFSDYNQLLVKYFAAEGVACKQQLYVAHIASEPDAAVKWVRKLPFVSGSPPSSSTPSEPKPQELKDIESASSSAEPMKVAFQYNKYFGAETMHSSKPVAWCHSFDLMKNMEASYISQCDILSTSFVTSDKDQDCYREVYDRLNRLIYNNNDALSKGGAPVISRLCLLSFGSVLYSSKTANKDSTDEQKKKLLMFMRALRGLLRQSLATCMITFPSHLYAEDPKFVQRMRHAADAVVQFSAFTGTFLFTLYLIFPRKIWLTRHLNTFFRFSCSCEPCFREFRWLVHGAQNASYRIPSISNACSTDVYVSIQEEEAIYREDSSTTRHVRPGGGKTLVNRRQWLELCW